MSDDCGHDYTEPVIDHRTGDEVSVCSDCDKTLGLIPDRGVLPDRWFRTKPYNTPQIKTAAEVLNGTLPRDLGERYIHICGACGHWLGAVHNGYFDDNPQARRDPPAFIKELMESLCPECGTAIFRHGGVVAQHSDAKIISRGKLNVRPYILNKLDIMFWRGADEMEVLTPFRDGSYDYSPRCPACGMATSYDGLTFDFHHWDYDEDIGCKLCRDCHSHIHRDMRAGEQAELSDGWRRDAVKRLHRLSAANGLEFHRVGEFKRRFNIPNSMNRLVRRAVETAQLESNADD